MIEILKLDKFIAEIKLEDSIKKVKKDLNEEPIKCKETINLLINNHIKSEEFKNIPKDEIEKYTTIYEQKSLKKKKGYSFANKKQSHAGLYFDSFVADQERHKKLHKGTVKIREGEILTAFANHLIEKYNIISNDGEIYIYENNFYEIDIKKTLIRKIYANYAGAASGKKLFEDYIIDKTNIPNDKFTQPSNLLNVNNGVLNMDTYELYKHDPKYLFKYKLNWNYDESVDETEVLNFLYASLSTKEQVDTLLEYLATCLMPGYEYQNILFCLGDTRTGKSKIQTLMIDFLGGTDRCSAISMDQLAHDSFIESLLKDKLANIADESEDVVLKKLSRIKALSGDSYITNRELHKKGETRKNEAILIFFCNNLPDLKKWDDNRNYVTYHDDAFYERTIILSFEHKFKKGIDRDTNILKKIITLINMSALLKLTIKARNRLITNKDFSMDMEETRERWIFFKSSGLKVKKSIKAFVDECLHKDTDKQELAGAIYKNYDYWKDQNEPELPSISNQLFYKYLTEITGLKKDRGKNNQYYFFDVEIIKDLT